MTIHYHKIVTDDEGYKLFLEIRKKYYIRHNLPSTVKIDELVIIKDAFKFIIHGE
jgi:hypothetical protein